MISSWTAESLLATIVTYPFVLVLPQHGRARLLGHVHAYLRSCPQTASGEFDLPLVTGALRALRGS